MSSNQTVNYESSSIPTTLVRSSVPHHHEVQFYEDDRILLDGLSRTIGSALGAGDSAIVIATKPHRKALNELMNARGLNVPLAVQQGRYIQLDAAETLSKFMLEDWPDASRFSAIVGSVVAQANAAGTGEHRGVTAFGEMVALLWKEGKTEAAIRLEQLWNELAQTHSFSLYCAYPMAEFYQDAHAAPFQKICAEHSQVTPAESYTSLANDGERHRFVSVLQQKARAFQTIAEEKDRLAAALAVEVEDLRRLHELSTLWAQQLAPERIMSDVLAGVTALHNTDMGLLSVYDSQKDELRVGASIGFTDEFLHCVERIARGSGACGTCMEKRERVVVGDTESDPIFLPYVEASRKAGFRAVHSTPLLDRKGTLVGVLSVHFRNPHTPCEREIRLTDLYAQLAVAAIENARLYAEAQDEISRRTEAEKALRESEQFTRSIVESSVDCIKVLDGDGDLLYMSSPGQRALDIEDVEPFLGKSWVEFWDGEDRVRAKTALKSAQGGTTGRMQGYCPSVSGTPKWWDVKLTPMLMADGKAERILAISREITELRQAEAAVLQAEKLATAGRLAATVAHEINNPLEAVTNFIFLAKNTEGLPARTLRHLEIADQELTRVSHIAQQTLGFYRDSSQPQLVNVSEAVRAVLTIYERKLKSKQIDVSCKISPELHLHTLQGEFKQALANLIVNSIDASQEGGKIWVRAHLLSNKLRITVADNGIGMSDAVCKRIFTPFFTTKEQVGTGLGLWTTKNMIEKQQGMIRTRSRQGSPSGTVMTMILPASARTVTQVQGETC